MRDIDNMEPWDRPHVLVHQLRSQMALLLVPINLSEGFPPVEDPLLAGLCPHQVRAIACWMDWYLQATNVLAKSRGDEQCYSC